MLRKIVLTIVAVVGIVLPFATAQQAEARTDYTFPPWLIREVHPRYFVYIYQNGSWRYAGSAWSWSGAASLAEKLAGQGYETDIRTWR
jgi:hypothetical protein